MIYDKTEYRAAKIFIIVSTILNMAAVLGIGAQEAQMEVRKEAELKTQQQKAKVKYIESLGQKNHLINTTRNMFYQK